MFLSLRTAASITIVLLFNLSTTSGWLAISLDLEVPRDHMCRTCLHPTLCYYVLECVGGLFAQPAPAVLLEFTDAFSVCVVCLIYFSLKTAA